MAKRKATVFLPAVCSDEIEENVLDSGSSPGLSYSQEIIMKADGCTEEDIDLYERYNMNHGERGVALIVNNVNFEAEMIQRRHGAELDERTISRTLQNIGFEVRNYNDMKWSDLQHQLLQVSHEDHSNRDCLFVIIMTHGEEGGLLHASDIPYRAEHVWEMFNAKNAPSLAGKPKIFLFQACRGMNFESNAVVIDSTDSGAHRPQRSLIVPSNADFLIAFSSLEGYYSFRNSAEGTWFIQDFCKELMANVYRKDLLSILTRTLRRIAYSRSSFNPNHREMHGRRQMPVFSSTLTRDLYFYKKSHQPEEAEPKIVYPTEVGNDEFDRQAQDPRTQLGITTRPSSIQSLEDELEDFDRYKVNYPIKGLALVFNHKTFQNPYLGVRDCADKDGDVISETLRNLGFSVRPFQDKTSGQIKDILSNVQMEDHSGLDCFLVVIMTHGEEDGVLHAWDEKYKTTEVWGSFTKEKASSLEGKPKIFLFQACRGRKTEESTKITDSTDFPASGKSNVPHQADFLLAYSCVEGHYSFKNVEGSWFIQDFCTELNKYSKRKDILLLLTDTFRRVVLTRKSYIPDVTVKHEKQQIPAFNSTLTKQLFLR